MVFKDRKFPKILMLSLALNVALMGALGYYLFKRGRNANRNYRRRSDYREALQLNEKQQAALDKMRNEFSERIKPLRTALYDERKKLGELLSLDEIDTLAIEQQINNVGKLQITLEQKVISQVLNEKNILPPEYREKYIKRLTWRAGRRRSHSRRDSASTNRN